MILGTEAIRQALADGRIICDPAPTKIEGAHIDVTIGPWTWQLNDWKGLRLRDEDPADVFRLHENERDVIFPRRSFSLAHTVEFIGSGPGSGIVPILHTRSTLARWGLSVHLSAGWGDEGYASRWTLEIVNPHDVRVTLPVGARVGCIVFQLVDGPADDYVPGTRYNIQRDAWTPQAMLPRKGNW